MGEKGFTENLKIKQKQKKQEIISSIDIPSIIFRDRNLKVLEVLVEFLKEVKGLNYHDIGLLLNRDERTIWTVYSRAKKKRAKQKDEELMNEKD